MPAIAVPSPALSALSGKMPIPTRSRVVEEAAEAESPSRLLVL
jgi:hypothetical protein